MSDKLFWEMVDGEADFYRTEKDIETLEIKKIRDVMEYNVRRARIPGGWLVAKTRSDAIAFVPDPGHRWK